MSEPRYRHFRAQANREGNREITLQLSPDTSKLLLNGIDTSQQVPFQSYSEPGEEVDPEIIEAVSQPRVLTKREIWAFGINTPLDDLCEAEARDRNDDYNDPILQDLEFEQLLNKYSN